MTSTRSSFNPLRYIAYLIREHLWLTFLLTGFYVLIGPVPLYLMLTSRLASGVYDQATPEMVQLQNQMAQMIHVESWLNLYVAAMAAGVVLAMVFGSYLKSKQQVNFYHSLPIRREQWLGSHVAAGFTVHTIVVGITLLMYFLVAYLLVPTGSSGIIRDGMFVMHFVQIELFFLTSFLLTTLAGQLTGNHLAQLAMTFVLQLFMLIIAATFMAVFSTQLSTFVGLAWLEDLTYWSLPSLFVHYTTQMQDLSAPWMTVKQWGGLVSVGILTFALSLFLYRRFPSERVSETLIYPKTAMPLKWFFLFCGPLLIGSLFAEATSNRFIAFLIGFVISGVLLHVVIEIAFHKSVHTVRKHIPSTAIILVVAFLFFMGCRADVAGFNRYLPETEDIEGVSVQAMYFVNNQYGPSPMLDRDVAINHPESIQLVHELAEALVENHLDHPNAAQQIGAPNGQEYTSEETVQIKYRLKNGSTVQRRYVVPRDAIQSETEALYNDAGFKHFLWQPIFDANVDQISHLAITPRDFNADMETGSGRWTTVLKGYGATTEEMRANQLLAALKQDLAERSTADLDSDALALVEIVLPIPNMPQQTNTLHVNIYAGDTRVLKVLDEMSAQGEVATEDDIFLATGIREVRLMRKQPEGQSYSLEIVGATSDPETMQEWLTNRGISDARMAEFGASIDDDYVFSVMKTYGVELIRNIKAGEVPEVVDHGQ